MLNALKKLFGMKKAEAPAAEVPYKVETPAEVKPTPVAEVATQAVVESIAKPKAKKTTAKKAPAAKKPRAPKKPKAV